MRTKITRSLLGRLQTGKAWVTEFVENVTRIDILVVAGLIIGGLLLCCVF